MASARESLNEACAPVFLYLTTFRRNSTTSKQTLEALHADLKREIEEVERRCDEDRDLRQRFQKAKYALIVAADQIVLTSAWPQRTSWPKRSLELDYFKTSVGGKKFFRAVEEVLNDPGEDAPEIAELFFTCMALGFQGELAGEPRELERRRRQLYEKARLPGRVGENLAPEAYGRDFVRKVMRLPTVGILRLALIAAAALVFWLVFGTVATSMFNTEIVQKIDAAISKL